MFLKVIVKCIKCNKDIEKYQSQVNHSKSKKFYCSKECRSSCRSEAVERVKFTCINCNNDFLKTKREIKGAIRQGTEIKYCSKKCMEEYKHVEKKEITCNTCGKSMARRTTDIYETNFCDVKCFKQYTKIKIVSCKQCSTAFEVKESQYNAQLKRGQEIRFCSIECKQKYQRKDCNEVNCAICNKGFYINNKKNVKDPCCSKKCRKEYIRQHHIIETVCTNCNKDIEVNKYRYNMTKKHFCNRSCFHEYQSIKKDEYEKCAHVLRTSQEYKVWRKSIFERDKYSCSECGNTKDRLHAHHIKHLNKIFIDNDFDIDKTLKSKIFNDINNGITLCADCHRKKHLFVIRNKKGQFCRIVPILQKER